MQNVVMLVAGNERGGAASHLVVFAKALTEHPEGSQFLFVCLGKGPLHTSLVESGVNVRLMEGNMRQCLSRLVRILREKEDVILHSHGPRMNVFASIAANLAKCPWTTTIHSNPNLDFLSSRMKTLFYPRFHKMRLSSAVGYFVGNPAFADLLPQKTVVFVQNAFQVPQLQNPKSDYESALKSRLHLPDSANVIGIAARLDPVKDIPTLLRAVAAIRDESLHLAIAGDGLERESLASICDQYGISDRVHFLGFVEDVIPFYAGLKVHVLPSLSEGASPFCLLEAGSVGVVNIGSDIPGILNILEDGKTGLCFQVKNSEQLAEKIRYIFDHPKEAKRLAERFSREVLPKFQPQKMLESYLRGYQMFRNLP
jgi:glycosyltransferase involved in cell wall biosynthesis